MDSAGHQHTLLSGQKTSAKAGEFLLGPLPIEKIGAEHNDAVIRLRDTIVDAPGDTIPKGEN